MRIGDDHPPQLDYSIQPSDASAATWAAYPQWSDTPSPTPQLGMATVSYDPNEVHAWSYSTVPFPAYYTWWENQWVPTPVPTGVSVDHPYWTIHPHQGSFDYALSPQVEPSGMTSSDSPRNVSPSEAVTTTTTTTTPSTLSTALSSPMRGGACLPTLARTIPVDTPSPAVSSHISYSSASTSSLAGALSPSPTSSTNVSPRQSLPQSADHALFSDSSMTTPSITLNTQVPPSSLASTSPSPVPNAAPPSSAPPSSSLLSSSLSKATGKRKRPDAQSNDTPNGFINTSHSFAPSPPPPFADSTSTPRPTIPTLAAVVADPAVTKLTPSGNKRVHGCWMCHKAFDRPSTLNKHLIVHTREKTHPCPHCQRKFGILSNMHRHMLRCKQKPDAVNIGRRRSKSLVGPRSRARSTETMGGGDSNGNESNSTDTDEEQQHAQLAAGPSREPAGDGDNNHNNSSSRPKRRRRAASATRWVPASLANFDLSPFEGTAPMPLPPVRPFEIPVEDMLARLSINEPSLATADPVPVIATVAPNLVIERTERGRSVVLEERDSFDEDAHPTPYHPSGWRGRLPGPRGAHSQDQLNITEFGIRPGRRTLLA